MSESRQKRFVQLKEQSMERFSNRERRIVLTLNFCVTTLEKLGGWAAFAIFPTDELNEETYIAFVKQRFHCVVSQLQAFKRALSRLSVVSSSEGAWIQSESFVFDETDEWRILPLKEKVSFMSKHFLSEGLTTKKVVMEKLSICHRDMESLFQWSFRTLKEMEHLLDEPMTDELYFAVRGKLSRILSNAGVLEEAADEVEKNMSKSKVQTHEKSPTKVIRELDLTKSLPVNNRRISFGCQTTSPQNIPKRPDTVQPKSNSNLDLTISSDETVSCGSTPEPPFSPRPEFLSSHPKINKDQKMTLKNKNDLLLNTL